MVLIEVLIWKLINFTIKENKILKTVGYFISDINGVQGTIKYIQFIQKHDHSVPKYIVSVQKYSYRNIYFVTYLIRFIILKKTTVFYHFLQ